MLVLSGLVECYSLAAGKFERQALKRSKDSGAV
jgi:hypothetical protein